MPEKESRGVDSKDAETQPPTEAIDPFDPKSFQTPGNISGGQDSPESTSGTGQGILQGKEVKLIAFDMGHVFVDFDWEEVCKGVMSKKPGLSRDDMRQAMAYLASLGYERGTIGTLDFLKELNQRLGVSLSLDEFRQIWTSTFQENPEMAVLLKALSERLPLYLLSNTNEEHYNHLQSSFNVARHFRELILSYQVGCSKPDARIYQEVLARSGLPPENILFIDDLEPNVKAARSLGIQTIQFTGIDNLKNDLKLFGIEV